MKKLTSDEFDRRFDAGEDMSDHLDWETAEWIAPVGNRLSMTISAKVREALDAEAKAKGLSREDVAARWLAERAG